MAIERYGSKTDVVVKLVLVFCVSLLSFAIGTLVGKKFSDNQHKLAQLEPATAEKVGHEMAAAESSAGERANADTETLSDQEISKLAEEFVTDDENHGGRTIASDEEGSDKKEDKSAHGEKVESKHEEKHAEEGHTVKHADKHAEEKAEPKKEMKAAATEKEDEPEEKSVPAKDHVKVELKKAGAALPQDAAASAKGKYTVQVAAYAKEQEAEAMAADLKGKGFSAFYVSGKVKGQTWYRVSVGLFSTSKEAKSYQADLLARAKVGSAIVRQID